MDPIPQIIIAESPNLSTLIVVNIQFPMEDGGVNRTVTECRQIAEPVGPNGQKLGGLKPPQPPSGDGPGRFSSSFNFFKFLTYKNLYLKLNLRPCGTHK